MKLINRSLWIVFQLFAVVAVLGCVGVDNAAAGDPTMQLSWKDATLRSDNKTPQASSDIASYQIIYSVDGGAPQTVTVANTPTVSYELPLNLTPRASAYSFSASIKTIDAFGQASPTATPALTQSGASSISFTVLPVAPGAPSSFKMLLSCTQGVCALSSP